MSQNNINPTAIELSEQELDEVAGGLAIANASNGSFTKANASYGGDARANARNGSRAVANDVGSGYYHKW